MIQVKLHAQGIAKFVLLKDEECNFIIRSDVRAELHKEILAMERGENDKGVQCLGGGRIEINGNNLRAYGYSVDFGMANNDLVELILTEKVKDKNILCEMGSGY
jgi:hypothetical protein